MKINKWKQKFWNIWNTIKQINKKCMQLFKAKERFNLKFQITLWKKSILTKNLNYVMKINIYIYIYKKIRIKKLRLVGNGKVCLDNLKNKAFTKNMSWRAYELVISKIFNEKWTLSSPWAKLWNRSFIFLYLH